MANNYTPPGVTVNEITDRPVTPGLAPAGVVAIVGKPQSSKIYQTYSKVFTVSSGAADALTLSNREIPLDSTNHELVSARVIINSINVEFDQDTDLVLEASTTNPDDNAAFNVTLTLTAPDDPDLATIDIAGSDLPNGSVKVTFVVAYTPSNYFDPTEIRDYATAEALYGAAFSDSGVSSDLTAGIKLAFENGARQIIAVPVAASGSTIWQDALDSLLSSEDVSIVVPVFSGITAAADQNAIFNKVQQFQQTADEEYQRLVFAVFGQDGTSASDLYDEAQDLRTFGPSGVQTYAHQCALVSQTKFTRKESTSVTLTLGGQFLAAAVAGLLAGRTPSQSLTRQPLAGVSGVDFRSRLDQNEDAANGLLVIEQLRNSIQVRHGITTSNGTVDQKEISVVRAKNRMVASIQNTLESQVIGQTYSDDLAATVVSGAVVGILQLLKGSGELVDFSDVQARILEDPTMMDVRFAYKPSFPLNYISVGFSINLSTATATVTQ